MDFQQIRKYVKGVLTNSFLNKTTLDKLSTSNEGNLLFDGKEISGSGGSETSNYFYLIDYNSMESVNSRDFTAEKDCYIEIETYANDNKEEHYYINDIFVGRESINGEVIYLKSFFLSKGDNLKLREGVSHSTTIRIFNLLNNKHTYSTEEKVVGKWIDGKPIYEKTIEFLFPGYGYNQVIYEFTDLDKCISLNGFCQTNTYTYLNISCFAGYLEGGESNYENVSLLVVDKKLCLSASRSFDKHSGKSCYCTIQYTKTTD